MALINIGTDPWVLEYEACEKLSREIMGQLHSRDKEQPNSLAYNSLSGKARVRFRQFCNEIEHLKTKLLSSSAIISLTADEKERRMRQLEQLQSRQVQMQRQLELSKRDQTTVKVESTGWADDDDEDISTNLDAMRNAPTSDLRAQQTRMIQEQDAGLEQLSQVIARQKRIATVISDEVDDQNSLLDDISSNMERVDARVASETGMIRTISRKDSTCGYWIIILLLMIVIIGLWAAPGR